MKKKFNYQKYDYSFLREKNDKYHWIKTFLGLHCQGPIKAVAQTIGFDLTEATQMNKPIGKLYWVDNYEPVRDINGTWTITFTDTPPSPPAYIRNYDDFVKAYTATSNTSTLPPPDLTLIQKSITTASNHINEWSKRGASNYTVTNSTVANMIKTK